MKLRNKAVYEFLDKWAPFGTQEEWDNSGLQVGSLDRSLGKILVCLDVTEAAVKAAVDQDVSLILAHHPLIFRPIKTVDLSDNILGPLIENRITVISSHTPLDLVPDGVSYALAHKIGLTDCTVLAPYEERMFCRLVFFVTAGSERQILEKLWEQGAGEYGLYDHCAYKSAGEGMFSARAGAKPAVKAKTPFRESRLEVIVRKDRLNRVIAALRESHPYEEPAYDVFEEFVNPVNLGYGIKGEYSKARKLSVVIQDVKEALGLDMVRFTGDLNSKIKRVAVCGGSGGGFIGSALAAGADLYISGDLKYHEILEKTGRISVIDVGHRASEQPVIESLAERLKTAFPEIPVTRFYEHNDFFQYR